MVVFCPMSWRLDMPLHYVNMVVKSIFTGFDGYNDKMS